MQTIEGEGYEIQYDPDENIIHLIGILRLHGHEGYAPINEVLETSLESEHDFTLDIQKLEFLNSSGIAMLSKYVIEIRKKKTVNLLIKGSTEVPWQEKSLNNLKRLMPTLELNLT